MLIFIIINNSNKTTTYNNNQIIFKVTIKTRFQTKYMNTNLSILTHFEIIITIFCWFNYCQMTLKPVYFVTCIIKYIVTLLVLQLK